MKGISERLSLFFALAPILLLVGYAVVQLYAGYAGIEYHLGVAWAIAAVIVTFVFRFGLLITIGAFFCALNIWNWHWIFSLLFAAPGLVFLAFMLPRIFASAENPAWSNEFHVWRMDWDSRQIRLYVDDVLMNSTNLYSVRNPDGANPFRDKRFYIVINLAIGGDNGGNPANTSFPSKYEIDWVRVYQ